MMITQSFLYNAIFFTYALVLQNFYHLDKSAAALYFIPFAIGNLARAAAARPPLRHHRSAQDDLRDLH